MSWLEQRRILLGVSGGVAAYKAAELTRLLRRAGAEVRVVLTDAAAEFVTPLTFQALSGQPVARALLDERAEAGMGHIELARWAERVVVAPATADLMARHAAGLADDLLATLCLATTAPCLFAPAMNATMWAHPATQANYARLQERGVTFVGPVAGEQACGEQGVGRLAEPAAILAAIESPFRHRGRLRGHRVLITAGPTREPVDPVRYLTNRSSGRMGFAVAAAARAAGAEVTLVTGPVALATPPGVERLEVETAEAMAEAVQTRVTTHDVFIGTAAVADYRPRQMAPRKIKRQASRAQLELVTTRDILREVACAPNRPFCVGFAAETEAASLESLARAKLLNKEVDMIAANAVGEGQGFETDDNALTVVWPGGVRALPAQPKSTLAQALIELIAERIESGSGASSAPDGGPHAPD